MKHATKQEASAARLAALKASREKRTHAKHERWAQEMEKAGWCCAEPDSLDARTLRSVQVLRQCGWTVKEPS